MRKLSWPVKISYGVGAFGKDLVYAIVATFFTFYLTDICKISPIFVGYLFLAARLFDAINDPIMGLIVDNTRSRWGRFRPWILLGTILNAIVLAFLFFNPGLSGNQQLTYVAVTYFLWGLTYTIMDIPYWSMVPALTSDEKERNTVSVIPRIFASIAWLVIGSFGLKLVKWLGGDEQSAGFAWLALAISGIFLLCSLVTVCFVKENVPVQRAKREHTSPKEMIRILVRNDQVIVVLILSLLFNISFQLSNGFAVYYFKYVVGVEEQVAAYLTAAGIAQLCGLFGYPLLASRVGRKAVFSASGFFPIAGFAFLLFGVLPEQALSRLVTIYLISGVVNFGIGLSLGILTVMLADVVDYGEYKFGTRNESILFSTQTFVVKFAGALSGFITGAGLALIGFVPDAVQTAGATWGIRIIMGGIPIVLSLLYLGIFWRFYRLDSAFLAKIRQACRGDDAA